VNVVSNDMGGRAVLRRVSANPSLRRVEAAFLGFSCAEFGVWLAVLVYAYQRGGTSLAAAIAVIQLLPAAAVAPIASVLTDRKGGAFGLWVGYIGQALSIGATAALLLSQAPSIAIYAAAVAAASAVTLTRPAHAALLPALVDDPRELTAANVVTGWLESVSFFVGPGLAGVLIAVDGPGLACALFAGGVTLSALLVAPLRSRGPAGPSAATEDKLEEAAAVMGVLRSEPGVAILLTLVAAQYVAIGALDVLVVVLAIKVLALGSSGAGYLDAAFGAGGVLGGIVAIGLIGRSRLVPPLLLAAFAWGAAFLLLGAWPTVVGAFALLAAAGAGRTLLDVAGRTLLQRIVPDGVRGRVFGVLEGASMLTLAIGSASVPLLASIGGPRTAVAGVGGLLVLGAAATGHLLVRLESAAPAISAELSLLRGSPIFGVLGAAQLEGVARSLLREDVAAGDVVVREGERGDRFYLVGSGRLLVTVAGIDRAGLASGDGFGEIALLRDGLRTATVTALEPVTLYALEREAFLDAVTGSTHAHRAAEHLVAGHLGGHAETASAAITGGLE
jgi:Cyclic nucleotide-binding domain